MLHEEPPRDARSRDVMNRWRRDGHEVLIDTARDPRARTAADRFLAVNAFTHDRIVLGTDRKTGYDVLVDDAPRNVLIPAADAGLARLIDHP